MDNKYFSRPLKTGGFLTSRNVGLNAFKYPGKLFTVLLLSALIIICLPVQNHLHFINLTLAQPAIASNAGANAQSIENVESQPQTSPADSSSGINTKTFPPAIAPAALPKTADEGESAAAAVFAVPRNDIKGLKNFAKVSDSLYRGQQPTAEGFRELKKMGIKTVLSLRAFHSDRSMLKGLGMHYKRMGIYTWDFKDDYVVNFLKLVTNPEYQPVFIHCQHGADRTGTMCAIYRCAVEGWNMNDAIKEMHNFGFHMVWSNLKKYLNSFDFSKIMTEVSKTATVEAELVE